MVGLAHSMAIGLDLSSLTIPGGYVIVNSPQVHHDLAASCDVSA